MTRIPRITLITLLTLSWACLQAQVTSTAPPSKMANGLMAVDAGAQPLRMTRHEVDVTIINGFAEVQVEQAFANPNDRVLEAIYRLPLPQRGVLSAFSIQRGTQSIQHGEVIARDRAQAIYRSERQLGNDAGLAKKQSYQWLTFQVTNVPAAGEVTIRHRYYQPLRLDHGIGRFLYAREPGGTEDAAAAAFWSGNVTQGQEHFRFRCRIHSAWPLADVRLPGYDTEAAIDQPDDGIWEATLDQPASDGRDVVVYYRLADDLPGRVELIPYKADADSPGYFMLVLTPGLDLKPRLNGVDHTFVLDVSGSMQGKLGTLSTGVQRALGRLSGRDRFRLVAFSTSAHLIQDMTVATPQTVRAACHKVAALGAKGGTDLHAGLQTGLDDLDDDRASCVVLITDGVTNNGVLSPKAFDRLSRAQDVRIFGFLMGNAANWPLIDTICTASGGFYQSVSNQDDIIGQILLAKEKMVRECLHDARLDIDGVRVFDTTDGTIGKIYHGQQLVLFGRYDDGGKATLTLDARLTGADKAYRTTIDFPDVATDHPELERLWAMNRVEDIQHRQALLQLSPTEARTAVRDLGVDYQIVTDQTAMLVLSDEAFQRHGIDRANRERSRREATAREARQGRPVTNHRVDQAAPMFNRPANQTTSGGPRNGAGAGTIGPWLLLALAALATAAWWHKRQTAA